MKLNPDTKRNKTLPPKSPSFPRMLSVVAGFAGLLGLVFLTSGCSEANAGPNGGDVIPLDEESANAEVLANEETGEMMIHTWDESLKNPKPIAAEPMSIEADGNTIELVPHPTASDPTGMCSRFYGQAEWVRGGTIQHGRLRGPGIGHDGGHFDWNRCWKAGRSHGPMWSEMPGHRQHMGHGKGGGHH